MDNRADISSHERLTEFEKGKIYLAIQFLQIFIHTFIYLNIENNK